MTGFSASRILPFSLLWWRRLWSLLSSSLSRVPPCSRSVAGGYLESSCRQESIVDLLLTWFFVGFMSLLYVPWRGRTWGQLNASRFRQKLLVIGALDIALVGCDDVDDDCCSLPGLSFMDTTEYCSLALGLSIYVPKFPNFFDFFFQISTTRVDLKLNV